MNQNIELFANYTASGAATGTISITGNALVSSLGITMVQEAVTVLACAGYKPTGGVFYSGLWNQVTGYFRGPNTANWGASVPATWESGSAINLHISFQVAEWTTY